MEYQDVYAILVGNTGLEYQLPQHHKCACHLLTLVSTADATAAEAVKGFLTLLWLKALHCGAFELWSTNAKRSSSNSVTSAGTPCTCLLEEQGENAICDEYTASEIKLSELEEQ